MDYQGKEASTTIGSFSGTRKLATIMFSDISGYTALMGKDEDQALNIVERNLKLHREFIKKHNGELVKELGDGLMIVFESPSAAVRCAKDILHATRKEPELNIHFGIHLGEITFTGNDVFGSGVNIAARIESESKPGEILISETVWDNIKNKQEFSATYAGTKNLKNVDQPIRVYHVHIDDETYSNKIRLIYSREQRNIRLGAVFIIILTLISMGYLGYIPWIDNIYKKQKIAILPFKNSTNDVALAYLGESLAEDVISNLITLKEFSVLSATSSFTMKDEGLSGEEIADKLKADLILTGEYEMVNNELRLTVELVSGRDNEIVGFSTFQTNLSKLQSLSNHVTQDLYASLNVEDERADNRRKSETNIEAYRYHALGRALLRDNMGQDIDSTISFFKKAIEYDENYIDAYLGIVQAYLFEGLRAEANYTDLVPKIRPLLLKVQSIDDQNPYLIGYQGILEICQFRYSKGEEKLKEAIQISPNYDIFYEWLGIILYIKGDFQASYDSFDEAIRLDPLNTFFVYFKGLTLIYMDRLSEAEVLYTDIIEVEPENSQAKWFMGMLRLEQERPEEAVEWLESRGAPMNPLLGYAYGIVGRTEDAKNVLQYLLDKSNDDYVPPGMIAMVYAGLGDEEGVIQMAQQASLIGDAWMSNWGQYSCVFEDYHDNPEYLNAISRVTYK